MYRYFLIKFEEITNNYQTTDYLVIHLSFFIFMCHYLNLIINYCFTPKIQVIDFATIHLQLNLDIFTYIFLINFQIHLTFLM